METVECQTGDSGMKVNLKKHDIRTGGKTYQWVDSTDRHSWTTTRDFERLSTSKCRKDNKIVPFVSESKRDHKKHMWDPYWHAVTDRKLIAKLDAAVEHATQKHEECEQGKWQDQEAKYAQEHGQGVRICDMDKPEKHFDLKVTRDDKNPDSAWVRWQVGKWVYVWHVEGIDMDIFEDQVTGWRPKD
jgi:hypothetical protein